MTEKPAKVTPMMAQYLEIKEQYKDCLLFYRMGDFYELFFEDAVTAAAELDIALTKRGKHLEDDIPMCGVPFHAYENYLTRLIKKGFKVAICEQIESPTEAKKRGTGSIVKRDVVRIITQGTLTEDVVLDAKSNNFLFALTVLGKEVGIAWCDVSTGDFNTTVIEKSIGSVASMLAKFNPKEILLSDTIYDKELRPAFTGFEKAITTLNPSKFNFDSAKKRLCDFYKVNDLTPFGSFTNSEISSCGVILDYVDITQKGNMPILSRPKKLTQNSFLEIDNASMRNLEIFYNTQGGKDNSLLSVINDTITNAGSRLLHQLLSTPLVDVDKINNRYDIVDFFANNNEMRIKTRYLFGLVSDIERSLSRLSCGRGGPRDLSAISTSLDLIPEIRNTINILTNSDDSMVALEIPKDLKIALDNLGEYRELCSVLREALDENLPLLVRDGNFITKGYDPTLDSFKMKRDESKRLIAELQVKYSAETSVNNLKINHNNQLGYYIEVTAKNANYLLENPEKFIHRQTMANAMRFSTDELIKLEEEIRSAGQKSLALELEIFEKLTQMIISNSEKIIISARAIAFIDVMISFANISVNYGYTRPVLDYSMDFEIKGGRHPIVEHSLKQLAGKEFIANDCHMDKKLWILTGPNMAGKSTYLRQNALLVIMAQIGCFVPADSLQMGIVDKLFSRVGASDDLVRGHSTFMVEMIETATILNQATEKSLVILDEIGRGTATFDGLSIAWAVVEYLHDKVKSRALFATHYHELVALSSKLSSVGLYTMKVKEWQGDIVFLHEIAVGSADRSYGIHVAKLAGLPNLVIKRAQSILDELENKDNKSAKIIVDELPLFSAVIEAEKISQTQQKEPEENPAVIELSELNPDDLTPKEALEKLYQLKKLIG